MNLIAENSRLLPHDLEEGMRLGTLEEAEQVTLGKFLKIILPRGKECE